ncbi:MAG TPA: hypothetical protein VMW65_02550 [Chloroflexota bacterium]|nr:hypothetical protein [Chloroflexota bacterium]
MHCLIDASYQVNRELPARHQWADEMRRAREAVPPGTNAGQLVVTRPSVAGHCPQHGQRHK